MGIIAISALLLSSIGFNGWLYLLYNVACVQAAKAQNERDEFKRLWENEKEGRRNELASARQTVELFTANAHADADRRRRTRQDLAEMGFSLRLDGSIDNGQRPPNEG